uniref:Tyrosyl-DNA phosphodiesterase isoform X2 n=1 Tax=Hirondellea gigas TaxID=1518452 RepID=A0A6A7G1Z1_9CRUS
MDDDARLAWELQKQFDEEEAAATAVQLKADAQLAHKMARKAHQISESEEDDEQSSHASDSEEDNKESSHAGNSHTRVGYSKLKETKTNFSSTSKRDVMDSGEHVSKDGKESVKKPVNYLKCSAESKQKEKYNSSKDTKIQTAQNSIKSATSSSNVKSNSTPKKPNNSTHDNKHIDYDSAKKERNNGAAAADKSFESPPLDRRKSHSSDSKKSTLEKLSSNSQTAASPHSRTNNDGNNSFNRTPTNKTTSDKKSKRETFTTKQTPEKNTSPQASKANSCTSSSNSESKHSTHSSSKTDKQLVKSLSDSSDQSSSSRDLRTLCKYGKDCYRKNPEHFKEFRHLLDDSKHRILKSEDTGESSSNLKRARSENSKLDLKKRSELDEPSTSLPTDDEKEESTIESKKRKIEQESTTSGIIKSKQSENRSGQKSLLKGFAARLEASEPYRVFLTKSFSLPETHKDPLGLVLPDLFHPSLGTVVETAQLSFVVDLDFLYEIYHGVGVSDKPLLLLYGEKGGKEHHFSKPTFIKVRMPFMYGTHHSKLMLLLYEDGLRVVVHTANLTPDDWYEKTQGVWISPLFTKLEIKAGPQTLTSGDSPTEFRQDLLQYLQNYKIAELTRWCTIIRRHDFSHCNAIFVGHVPGYHKGPQLALYGQQKLRRALGRHCSANRWRSALTEPVTTIVQCSSIGSLGATSSVWLCSELARSLSGGVDTPANKMAVIYPSEESIRTSSQGWMGGSCLPYSCNTHARQLWLERHLYDWSSEKRGRSKGMPHIKTYTRVNKDETEAQFLLLTSANLSKAAWGQLQKQNSQHFIRSYEAGVLLLPKFLTGEDYFPVSTENPQAIPLPYDLPLTPYTSGGRPWLKDTKKKDKDINGDTYLC